MFFSETWLKPNSTMDYHLLMNGFPIFHWDRAGQTPGGRILVYVKNRLKYRERADLEHGMRNCRTLNTAEKVFIYFLLLPIA